MADTRNTNIAGYKVIKENVNANQGMLEIFLDNTKKWVVFDTNMERIVINKPFHVNGNIYTNNDKLVLTEENIKNIKVDVGSIDGFKLDDTKGGTNATTDNALWTAYRTVQEIKTKVVPENIPYTHLDNPELDSIKKALDKILYVPLTISSFTNNQSIIEMGTPQTTNVTFSWAYNKANIISQSINGNSLPITDRTYVILPVSTNTTMTLSANDEKSTITRSSSIQFLNGRYWGTSNNTTLDNALILSLSKELTEYRNKTFTVNADPNQYIYYSYPKRLGKCKFSVGGFEGGFEENFISFTNSKGYIEDYYIYKSTNHSLGNTTVIATGI